MIILELFLTFLQIGAFTFGGGYAMISLVREQVLAHGWLTEAELLNMIAVAESTPGPIAVNMATFVGSTQGGEIAADFVSLGINLSPMLASILGSAAATLGVVLPSFVIILMISMAAKNFMQTEAVQAALKGVRPCVVALILATALTLALSNLLGISGSDLEINLDLRAVIIFAAVVAASFGYKKLKGKKLSPIIVIVISALLGIILYSL